MDITTALLLAGLGLMVGTLGTLIGAGGGFILVPVLLFVYPKAAPETITSISLAIVFLNAASGSFAYARKGRIDYRSAFVFAVATLPGAIAGAMITSYMPRRGFDLFLGIFFFLIAVFLFLKPSVQATAIQPPADRLVQRTVTEKSGEQHRYAFHQLTGIVLSFIVGFLSSLLGIGGGIIHVPALINLLHFPVHIATATSHFILAIMALAGTIVHIIQGNFKDGWLTTIMIGIGVLAGAQIGARLSDKVKGVFIVRALAFALLLVGIRLVVG